MKYMVIETYKLGARQEVYDRYEAKGRMLPRGLTYVDSWVSDEGNKCFQLMESENAELFDEWIVKWNDLVDFEIVPVHDSPTKTG